MLQRALIEDGRARGLNLRALSLYVVLIVLHEWSLAEGEERGTGRLLIIAINEVVHRDRYAK